MTNSWTAPDTTSYDGLTELLAITIDDQVYRFVNSNLMNTDNPLDGQLTWGGYQWNSLPFETSTWSRGGEAPKPKISLPDVNGIIYLTLRSANGAVGCDVERWKVLNPQPTGSQPSTYEAYKINTWTATGKSVSLELATHFDLAKSKLPGFKMTRKNFPGLSSALLRK